MSQLTIGIRVDSQEILRAILGEIVLVFNSALHSINIPIKNRCAVLIDKAIRDSSEYHAMLPGGTLYGQIGEPNIESVLDDIISNIIENDIIVNVESARIVGNQVELVAVLLILELSYAKLLSMDTVKFFSEGKSGDWVNWLQWLLTQGDRKVVTTHRFVLPEEFDDTFLKGKKNLVSRTNTGIMKRSSKGWGFEEYAGTNNDNWLTRAIGPLKIELGKIFEQEIQKRF